MFALDITRRDNKSMNKCITSLLTEEGGIIDNDVAKRKAKVMSSTPHPIVDDDCRIAFKRLPLSSHRLRIETGRWARIPSNERLCQCGGGVQTEKHVLCDCDLVSDIRHAYGNQVVIFNDFMSTEKSKLKLMMVKQILKFYGN